MRNLKVLTAVLLSSSMLAATAAAQTESQSQSRRCRSFEQNLPECQTIGVSAAAAGGALDLLSKDYQIVPIEKTASSVFPSHLVIGAADLDNAQIIALLRRSYRVGKTVAIVGATQDQANQFHRLVRLGEAANCRLANGQLKSSLYGLQQSNNRFPPQNSSYCLINLDERHPASDRRWLRERFGLTPPQPAAGTQPAAGMLTSTRRFIATPNATSSDDTNQLTSLSDQTHCSAKTNNSYVAIQADLYINTMRNFTDTGCSTCKDVGADYYLVQDNSVFQKYSSAVTGFVVIAGNLFDTTNNVQVPTGSYNLEFADPETTTTYESSYTNGSSVTASGSVGVTAEGPNVTVGGSVTASNEQTYNPPPTMILNTSNLPDAMAEWQFTPQSWLVDSDFAMNPTWTWFVPQDSYPSGGTGSGGIQFDHFVGPLSGADGIGGAEIIQICNVPYPFSTWTVNPPHIDTITQPQGGAAGTTFTINGENLYPSSVVAVLIDGVPATAFSTATSATAITVTLPKNYAVGSSHIVQVNTQFNGATVFSNNDVPLIIGPTSS